MKKVGIITMHQVLNYGSFMQAYASQRAVEKLGYPVEIIDYKYPNEIHVTEKAMINRVLHALNVATKALLPGSPYKVFINRYKAAHSRYYHLSNSYATRENILRNPPDYDIYMIGSDQVWNDKFIKNDDTFFAGFAPKGKKKIAFASSFGKKEVNQENIKFYQENLSKLSHIAVREDSGVELVKRLTGRQDVKQVLDPSLLLDSKEWMDIMVPYVRADKKYIFVYGSYMHDYMLSVALQIAKKMNWDVYRVNGTIIDYFSPKGHCLMDVGPCEWLGLINGAELVICCSFHGLVFSIQFNRPFLAAFTGNEQFDSRFDSLLRLVAMQSHRLDINVCEQDYLKIAYNTDWNRVNSVIARKRAESIDVLAEFLEN